MKRTILFCITLICFLASGQIVAQSGIFSGIKITRITATTAVDQDMIHGLSYEQLVSRTKGPHRYDYSGLDFGKEDVTGMICENPNFRVNVGLAPQSFTNGEFSVGLGLVLNRVEDVYYANETSSISFFSWGHEVNFDFKYAHRVSLGPVGLVGGIGTNVGVGFGGAMDVQGHNVVAAAIPGEGLPENEPTMYTEFYDTYNLRTDTYTRFFVELGPTFTIRKRLEIAPMFRKGIGWRSTPGAGQTHGLTHNSVNLTMSWILR